MTRARERVVSLSFTNKEGRQRVSLHVTAHMTPNTAGPEVIWNSGEALKKLEKAIHV